MRIYVTDLSGGRDPHVAEYYGPADGCELESVFYISVPRRIAPRDLRRQIEALRSQWWRAAEAIVLRLHPPDAGTLLVSDSIIDDLQHTFEGLPMLVADLDEDRTVRLTPIGSAEVSVDPTQLLDAVRFAEFDSWLRQPGVVLPVNSDFHYEGPNGYRYESFMRVGTAIQGTEMLDAVAFWLQPYLKGRSIVVLDAWTILSVGLNLDRYAARSGPPSEAVVGVECLGAYNENMDDLKARLEALKDKAADEQPAVLLVSSIVSKSRLRKRLEKLIGEAGFTRVQSVSLYGGPGSEGRIFCQLRDVARCWPPDACPLESPRVTIAPSTYLVEVGADPKTTRISRPIAQQAEEFFERYRGRGCFSVHREQHDNARHHCIHLDVGCLVDHPEFSRTLKERLAELPEVDLILSPRHDAAAALARKVSSLLGVEWEMKDEGELINPPLEVTKKLRAAKRILLVDDVLITGSRIRGYRNCLRMGEHLSGPQPPELYILVGVARLDDNTLLRGMEEMADDPNRFHRVETLLLPNWGRSECPWCWELRRFEELESALPQTERFAKRKKDLENTEDGLHDSLFIPWLGDDGGLPPEATWELGPGSVFPADSQTDLFAAVASAIQSLRSAGDLTEQPQYPLARVLGFDRWLIGRYYDPVITAAILRSTHRHDLRTAKIEPALLKATSERLQEEPSRGVRGELIMAAARGHLPIGSELAPDGELVNDPRVDVGIAGLMRLALQSPSYSTAS
jgi:hypothetical protein